jgi:PAS domain S-box-containing protein
MTEDTKTAGETPYEISYLRVLVADLESRLRQTDELLHVVTEQYRRITEVVSDYLFSVHIVDGNPIETVHGRGCLLITGYSPEEFASSSFLWISMVFEDDRALVLKHVTGILSGKDSAPFEHRIVRKDGAVRWVLNTPVCQYDSSGKLLAYDGLIQDITERKHADEALHQSEQKYRIVADFTYDWEEWVGPDGHYIYVSPSCERVTGYSQEDFIANKNLVASITHPADRAMVTEHYKNISKENKEPQEMDFRIINKKGEECWISHSCQSVYSENGSWLGRRASNHDISRRRRLMDELMKARELEAVGILAGGIANDFDNLISSILGNISMAKTIATPDKKLNELLSNAEEASLRSRDLTQQLMIFSTRGAPSKKEFSVAEILKKIALTENAGNGIKFASLISDGLMTIEADEGQLTYAIRTLVINAREAMAGKGLLTIKAENISLGADSNIALAAGDYLKISVADTGVGIPAENIERIFDPYFTTKDFGLRKGTGLGLAIAGSIVTNHHGIITVDSEVGKGTTFCIYLPTIKKDDESA